jgi:hypothetical protein
MKKAFAVILFILGGASMVIQVRHAGGDGSKIAAAVGVCLIPIVFGAWL